MIVLGLTGSIGMGKSATARIFTEEGIPVHDSDEAVHRLYGGKAAPIIEAVFPGTVVDGVVDRALLARHVLGEQQAIDRLEKLIHPLVRADADAFLDTHRRAGTSLAVLDIPLLFETDGRGRVDKVVVVTASPEIQRERVLSRAGMTAKKFEAILSRQMPDTQKRQLGDFVIDTGHGPEAARAAVRRIIAELTG